MAGAPASDGRRRHWALPALLLLCALPHLLRMASSLTVPADSFYGHAAYMLSRGYRPYLDFTQVAFPLAEGVLALALRAFGHDLRVFEVANLLVILAVAAALRTAARRMLQAGAGDGQNAADPRRAARAGAIAALAWSWSPWVIHFDLFERETWAALGTALALAAYFGGGMRVPTWRRATAVAGGLALAFLVKITALMPALALLAHLLLRRRGRDASRLALVYAALLAGATGLCLLAWGAPFLQQVFLFGFFRNPDHAGALDALARLLSWTDPLLALGFAALLACGLLRLREACGAVALVMLVDLAFLLLVSPTLWDHNLISFAPAGALLLAGALTARPPPLRAGLVALALVTGGILTLPERYMPEMPGPFGPIFAGWPRDGMEHRATFLERYSGPDDVVCSLHAWWAVQAGRVEFIRYHDVSAIALAIAAGVRRDGLSATWAQRRGPLLVGPAGSVDRRLEKLGPYEGRLVACSMAYERPLLLQALARHEISLLMEPLPPHLLDAPDLLDAGYARFEDHELGVAGWRPADGISHPIVRALFER